MINNYQATVNAFVAVQFLSDESVLPNLKFHLHMLKGESKEKKVVTTVSAYCAIRNIVCHYAQALPLRMRRSESCFPATFSMIVALIDLPFGDQDIDRGDVVSFLSKAGSADYLHPCLDRM